MILISSSIGIGMNITLDNSSNASQNAILLENFVKNFDFEIWANRPSGFETGFIRISDGAAIDYARKLNLFGYSAGVSSGALLTASLNHIDDRGNYLMLFGDNSSRYKHLLLDK